MRTVKELYPAVTNSQMLVLRDMTRTLRLSLRVGDLLMLNGRWYVTHFGLLRVAQRRKCSSIKTELVENVSNPSEGRWLFKATVLKSESQTFVGYGDADPSNVSFLVHGAEMRIAETRAVNRALRKAYGIDICSVEEIGSLTERSGSSPPNRRNFLPNPPAGTTADGLSAITSANLSVSINSTPRWSSRMPLTSVASGAYARPLASRSKTSSLIRPIGPTRIAMPYCPNSTAISARKKVPHEASDCRLARSRSVRGRSNPRRTFSGSSA